MWLPILGGIWGPGDNNHCLALPNRGAPGHETLLSGGSGEASDPTWPLGEQSRHGL